MPFSAVAFPIILIDR